MSRNKFGELVKKYVVDGTGNAERRVLGHLPGDYVGMNVYEALNVMLNILYEKDGASIEEAATKVSKVAGIYYGHAEDIVLAHKKYKKEPVEASNKLDKIDYFCDKYDDFRNKVSCLCQESGSFKRYFALNDYMEAVETIDKKIRERHAINGLGLDGTHNTIMDLIVYIESTIGLTFGNKAKQLISPLVLWHPLYTGAEKKARAKKKEKVRGHDKYRFFINKPGIESYDIKRVLEEAEKEGYDLVAINNTNSNNPPFIYGTASVVRLMNITKPFETKARKGWYIIDTKLTITELFEAIKEAEESKVKVVVERYRVKAKS